MIPLIEIRDGIALSQVPIVRPILNKTICSLLY